LAHLPGCGRQVFFTGENLDRFPQYRDRMNGVVDLSLGFDLGDTDTYLRFPLWLLYTIAPEADRAGVTATLRAMEDHRRRPADRFPAAVMVASHDESGIRGRLGDLTGEFMPVDYGGRFRHNLEAPLAGGVEAKLGLLSRYAFHVCPENSNRPGYVTEKLFHAFRAGCLPIYWGGGGRPEPAVIDPRAVLTYDPAAPHLLRERLADLVARPTALAEFRQRPVFQPTAVDFIDGRLRALEERLLQLLSS
jgi:hypothetical protein